MALVLNLPMSLRTGRFDSYYRTKIQAQKRFDFMEQTVEEAKNGRPFLLNSEFSLKLKWEQVYST